MMGHEQHSDKLCWCGGHNHSNAKKNKKHNSTKRRLLVKFSRRFVSKMKGK